MSKNTTAEELLKTPWQLTTCATGTNCWCRGIQPASQIQTADGQPAEIIPIGLLHKDIAAYLVATHNANLQKQS